MPLSVDEASKALYLDKVVLASAIRRFQESSILSASSSDPEKFEYSPRTVTMSEVIDELDHCFIYHRLSIINLIFAGPAQLFADAFKLKSEEEP